MNETYLPCPSPQPVDRAIADEILFRQEPEEDEEDEEEDDKKEDDEDNDDGDEGYSE